MAPSSARVAIVFSCIGHAYMHMFTAFYFVIVLALEDAWRLPYHELIELWTLGALLVGLGALPAGWIADRWSARGMMVTYFIALGAAGIACGMVDRPTALLLGLAAIGLAASIYHPVGIAWLVRSAERRGRALGINGMFGAVGVATAGLAAGGLIDLYGWRMAFVVPGVVSLATGLALLLAIRMGWVSDGRRAAATTTRRSRGDMVRAFMILVLTMLIIGVVFQATQAALPKVFDLRIRSIAGEGTFGIGAIVAVVFVAGGVMQMVGGLMADRYPLKPLYVSAFCLQVPVLALVAGLGGLPLIASAILLVLLSTVALPAENLLLARYTPDRHQSLAFGVKFVLAFSTAPLALQLVATVQQRTGEFVWLFGALAAMVLIGALAAAGLPGGRRAGVAAAAAE